MKGALVMAAAGLLGTAQASGVHSLKLKKVPLAKQLVRTHLPDARFSCFLSFWRDGMMAKLAEIGHLLRPSSVVTRLPQH